jgi:dTDP-4-amino-4,6-dideoxygalactose transaminase
MAISNHARDKNRFVRHMEYFPNARTAFTAYLRSLDFSHGEAVLLPAFIGWSAQEGSGVFDPIAQLGLNHGFYAMDEHLNIDLDSLERAFTERTVRLFVIIHYFGYVDPHYRQAVAIARRHGALVLEDEAHALYTDLVCGLAGRLGDAAIFSLHKMLPVSGGGLLCLNGNPSGAGPTSGEKPPYAVMDYDLYSIAQRRVENAVALEAQLREYPDDVIPLRPAPRAGEVPQTFPVVIRRVRRDRLYEVMNAAGWGVVTLYHTLIEQISREEFPRSFQLSGRILNLPVHQEAQPDDMGPMVQCLMDCVATLKSEGGAHAQS